MKRFASITRLLLRGWVIALLLDHHGVVEVPIVSIVIRPSGPAGLGVASEARLRRKFHPFLLLSLVAKPDPHHVFLQIQLFGYGCDFLTRGPGLHGKVGLQ